MSQGHWRIKPSELGRAINSIRSVGLHIQSVELSADGTIKISVTETGESNPADENQ